MGVPIPAHAKRIEVNGDLAYLWTTADGLVLRQGAYQIDLTNSMRDGKPGHSIDAFHLVPRDAVLEQFLVSVKPGHLGQAAFLELSAKTLAALRLRDQRWPPPAR